MVDFSMMQIIDMLEVKRSKLSDKQTAAEEQVDYYITEIDAIDSAIDSLRTMEDND